MTTVKELNKGDYFTMKPIAEPKESQVYVRGEYDRESKTYSCHKFSDINSERSLKGSKEIFTDMIF